MRQVRDSFLHFLSDNLTGIPVHNVRTDTTKPDDFRYQSNAVNVKFIDASPNPHISQMTVEVCIMNDDELTAVDWLQQLYDILSSAYYTPKMDYTNPASPVATGTNIYWDMNLTFKNVSDGYGFDYRCRFVLNHKVDS